jgi:hypothetical protein
LIGLAETVVALFISRDRLASSSHTVVIAKNHDGSAQGFVHRLDWSKVQCSWHFVSTFDPRWVTEKPGIKGSHPLDLAVFGRIAIGSPSRSINVPLLVFSYFTWQGIFVISNLSVRLGGFFRLSARVRVPDCTRLSSRVFGVRNA